MDVDDEKDFQRKQDAVNNQANANDDTMRLFLYRLVEKLDKQDPRWRKDTVIQLDGARWHTSEATQKVMRHLRLPVVISAPHGFEVAAVEMVFAALKKGSLNPYKRKMSQKVSLDLFI